MAGTRLVDAPELVPSPSSPEVFYFRERGVTSQELLRTFFLDPGLVLTTRLKSWIGRCAKDGQVAAPHQGDPRTAAR